MCHKHEFEYHKQECSRVKNILYNETDYIDEAIIRSNKIFQDISKTAVLLSERVSFINLILSQFVCIMVMKKMTQNRICRIL